MILIHVSEVYFLKINDYIHMSVSILDDRDEDVGKIKDRRQSVHFNINTVTPDKVTLST
jgi:hypothetical protein